MAFKARHTGSVISQSQKQASEKAAAKEVSNQLKYVQRTHAISHFLVQKQFFMQNEDHTAIGMDYCPGGELYMLLRVKKRFSEPEA